MSEYNLAESTSAKAVLHDNGSPEIVNLDFGKYDIAGEKYTDKFCLIQNTNQRTDTSGRMCI
jgi:hypothetical protein